MANYTYYRVKTDEQYNSLMEYLDKKGYRWSGWCGGKLPLQLKSRLEDAGHPSCGIVVEAREWSDSKDLTWSEYDYYIDEVGMKPEDIIEWNGGKEKYEISPKVSPKVSLPKFVADDILDITSTNKDAPKTEIIYKIMGKVVGGWRPQLEAWLKLDKENHNVLVKAIMDGCKVDADSTWAVEWSERYFKCWKQGYLMESFKADWENEVADSRYFFNKEEAEAVALLTGGKVVAV